MINLIEFIKVHQNLICLLVGTFFAIFSLGRFNISISIFIWPYCFLNYLHNNDKKLKPLLIVLSCLVISNMLRWIGASNVNIGLDFIVGIILSIENIIPFIIDDLLYNKINNKNMIFIFPLIVSLIEFIFSYFPVANINIYSYAIRENLSFLQILSLFGPYFLSFVISLFASILDYSVRFFSINKINNFIFLYVAIVLVIYLYGFIYLIIPNGGETIKAVSALGVSQTLYDIGKESLQPLSVYINYINKTMVKAHSINASLISYAEEGFCIEEDTYNEIIEAVQNFSILYNINTALTLDVEFNNKTNQNMAIFISNNGEVLYTYSKHHLIPYVEMDYTEGDSDIKILDTNMGKLTIVICYDIDFPNFINNISRKHIDLLLVLSWDYPGIAEYHSNEARYRAIEGGFNLIKNTAHGNTIVSDYKGNILSTYFSQECEDYFVISNINNHRVKALYSYIGFFFNYLYLIAIAAILVLEVIRKKSEQIETTEKVICLSENSYEEDH